MLAALGALLVLAFAVKLVIAMCGYTITWRLAALIAIAFIVLASCSNR